MRSSRSNSDRTPHFPQTCDDAHSRMRGPGGAEVSHTSSFMLGIPSFLLQSLPLPPPQMCPAAHCGVSGH